MESNFTDDQLTEAKDFTEFYTDLLENYQNTLPYYLSETATLDWFGQTVKGAEKISSFLKSHASCVKHFFPNPRPTLKIGHRNTHVINFPTVENKIRQVAINKPPVIASSEEKTPPKDLPGSSNHVLEQGQGDGLHNCETGSSPTKRSRLEDLVMKRSVTYSPVKLVSAEGHVEFRKRSCKKLQRDTRWTRPCKLEVAYSTTDIKDSTIHLIIYSSNMKSRRVLFQGSDADESSD